MTVDDIDTKMRQFYAEMRKIDDALRNMKAITSKVPEDIKVFLLCELNDSLYEAYTKSTVARRTLSEAIARREKLNE